MIKILDKFFGGKKEKPKEICPGCGKPIDECICEKKESEE